MVEIFDIRLDEHTHIITKEKRDICDLCSCYDLHEWEIEYAISQKAHYVHSTKNYPVPNGYKIVPRHWTTLGILKQLDKGIHVVKGSEGTRCSASDWNTLEHICEDCFNDYWKLEPITTKALTDMYREW